VHVIVAQNFGQGLVLPSDLHLEKEALEKKKASYRTASNVGRLIKQLIFSRPRLKNI